MTKDLEKAGSVIQPFRNYKIDFEPPQITTKAPLFGTDKWVECQNQHIAKRFNSTVRQIETLYRKEAEQQVKTAQQNVLAGYREYYQLKRDVEQLSKNNDELKSILETMLDQLSNPSLRTKIFDIVDALIGGTPVAVSSGGGGGSTSDLRWDGRQPDEEEEAYRRRCMLYVSRVMMYRKGCRRK